MSINLLTKSNYPKCDVAGARTFGWLIAPLWEGGIPPVLKLIRQVSSFQWSKPHRCSFLKAAFLATFFFVSSYKLICDSPLLPHQSLEIGTDLGTIQMLLSPLSTKTTAVYTNPIKKLQNISKVWHVAGSSREFPKHHRSPESVR